MKFFLGRKSTSFRTQRIFAKDVDLRPSAPKVLSIGTTNHFAISFNECYLPENTV